MTWDDIHRSGGSWPLRWAGRSLRHRNTCVSNTHINTHSHTSPLLPTKSHKGKERSPWQIQLKQLICTDISLRALERCTAEPLLHCTTHTALLQHQAQRPWGRDTGVVCSFAMAFGLSNCTPGVMKMNMRDELQKQSCRNIFPLFQSVEAWDCVPLCIFKVKVLASRNTNT